ncbi:MAG: glycoside hydrolase family 31 protein [Sedimentisphaerales bacterium]|nr:glycoside hydrolase family 31 protein [Sedimentisphaerales bacterium]
MKRIVLLLTILSLASCVFAKAEVEYKDSSFIVTSPHLKQPLSIGSRKIPMFLQTRKEKFFLKDEPVITRDKNSLTAVWDLTGGKKVTVGFVVNKDSVNIDLKAVGVDDIYKWGFSLDATENEYFTGLMERVVDGEQDLSWAPQTRTAMNLKGEYLTTVVKPTVSLYCPFYISSRNYSLFVEGTWPGTYDFCRDNPGLVKITFEGPSVSMILNTAAGPAELIQAHSLNVGPTIVPPKWAFGPWRWRNNHVHRETYYDGTKVTAPYNSETVEDFLMMKAFDIPMSIYWVDRPWAKGPRGYDDFEWDPVRFPNAVEMIKWINDKDVKFVLWIGPWIMGDMAIEAKEKGYTVQGQLSDPRDQHYRALIDYTNPEAVTWWQEKGLAKVLNQGVRGFKLDRAEQLVPNDYENKAFDSRTSREYHNDYPRLYTKATYDISKKICGDDFVLLPRAGYSNSSRYAIFWGGDIGATKKGCKVVPEALRAAIIALLRSSVIGFPIWGSDTGGYSSNFIDHEVTARWLAFSCFCPVMEVGPIEDRGFWSLKEEPAYDTKLIAIWRLYSKIHTELIDYSYEYAKEARKTGMPIARPLFILYPEQKEAWNDWKTYMYGPDILVSAIWRKGKTQHPVYLPAGEEWIDAWNTDKVYTGGQTLLVDTPLHKIPIFIRKGAKIKLGDLNKLYEESMKIASVRPDLKKLQELEFGK